MNVKIFISILFILYSFILNTYALSVDDSLIDKKFKFTENKGQVADFDNTLRNEFLYYTKSDKLDIYFRNNGITYIFKSGDSIPNTIGLTKEETAKIMDSFFNKKTLYYRLDVDFKNANDNIVIEGNFKSDSYSNFYLPHCPDGIINVSSFNKIKYTNVYNGVDFEFYFSNDQFKYDIIIEPDAEINNIELEFNSGSNIFLKGNEILIQSPVGDIIESLPRSYYIDDQENETDTEITYELIGNIVKFKTLDKLSNTLIIDPQISWTTYYDDCFWNGSGSSIDAKGNQVVVVSYGFSDFFPILDPGGSAYYQNLTAGSGDYRILKFDNDGVRIWATYYGGTGYDHSPDVVIDYNTNIYVAGHTESTNIPCQNAGGYYDGTYDAGTYGGGTMILRFNSSGVRTWGTHYDYVQYPMIEVDNNNNIYVVGRSEYNDPPVLALAGAYNQALVAHDAGGSNSDDIFIIKFNASSSRVWATNLGGSSDEFVQDVKCSSDNYLNILGYGDNYYGTGIVTYNPGGGAHYDNTLGIGTGGSSTDRDDALIYRFNTTGALVWGTAFSGTLAENMQQGCMTTDNSNNIYIFGETRSTNLPCVNPGGGAYFDNVFNASGSGFNPFIAKFNPGGVLQWSTYFGTYGLGFGMNFSHYLGVSESDNLILVSSDGGGVGGSYPLVPRVGDYNATLSVYMGVYIAEFASNLSIAWSTYYAGTTDRHTLGDCALSSNSCGYELYMTTNWEKYNASAADPPWVKPIPSSYQDVSWMTTGNRSGLITRFSILPSTPPTSASVNPSNVCQNTTTDITLTATGGTLGTGAVAQWYTGSCGGTFVGTGNPLTVSQTLSSSTTYYVRYAGDCGPTSCVTVSVTVDANVTPTFNALGPYCVGEVPDALPGSSTNSPAITGTWSPATISTA
ncbi:MAG TPA: SBBP repeat-containing protein, partial [Bacteroidales bacterium]|nr:SBBP repeat-containing protein [Bacteroidales bacterium]